MFGEVGRGVVLYQQLPLAHWDASALATATQLTSADLPRIEPRPRAPGLSAYHYQSIYGSHTPYGIALNTNGSDVPHSSYQLNPEEAHRTDIETP